MSERCVCLVFDRSYVDAHYFFRETITHFLSRGWSVDLFVPFSAYHPLPTIDSPRLAIRQFSGGRTRRFIWTLLIGRKYDAILATPQRALFWAAGPASLRRIPLVYFSDEIYSWEGSELLRTGKIGGNYVVPYKLKKREMTVHHQCCMTVSLSHSRFELLRLENQMPPDHPYAVLPNAPAESRVGIQSSFYHEVLSIPNEKPILVHCGGTKWDLIDPFLRAASTWRNNFFTVFHGRHSGAFTGFPSNRNENIRYHSEVLPSNLMPYAVSSAEIGLLLYNQDNPAEAFNPDTSGKLGLFLSCGLPVICCNSRQLDWINEEGCGVRVNTLDEIPAAVDRILSDRERYSRNAIRVFLERYRFTPYFDTFMEKFESVLRECSSPRKRLKVTKGLSKEGI